MRKPVFVTQPNCTFKSWLTVRNIVDVVLPSRILCSDKAGCLYYEVFAIVGILRLPSCTYRCQRLYVFCKSLLANSPFCSTFSIRICTIHIRGHISWAQALAAWASTEMCAAIRKDEGIFSSIGLYDAKGYTVLAVSQRNTAAEHAK